MKAVIIVNQGLVMEVFADERLDYIIIDQDVQDEDECRQIQDMAGHEFTAALTEYTAGADPKTVEHYFNQIPPM